MENSIKRENNIYLPQYVEYKVDLDQIKEIKDLVFLLKAMNFTGISINKDIDVSEFKHFLK